MSIEGSRETHDRIRGAGSFDRAIEGLRSLRRSGIRTLLSFTAHRGNYLEFPAVARLGRALAVDRVWADRMVPCGGADSLSEEVLAPAETRRFFEILLEEKRRSRRGLTEIALHRALQFILSGGRPYRCSAGDSLLALRQQLAVLRRSVKRSRVRNRDRLFWIWLSRFWAGWSSPLAIVKPQTVIRWHRARFRLYWRRRSRKRPFGQGHRTSPGDSTRGHESTGLD